MLEHPPPNPLRMDPTLILPQSRRRAYSDSVSKSCPRPVFRRLGSPPPICYNSQTSSPNFTPTPLTTIEARVPLTTPSPLTAAKGSSFLTSSPSSGCSPVDSATPRSSTLPKKTPLPALPPPPCTAAGSPSSPGSPSLSRYAGIVVGSPLGSGPLNGQHLTSLDLSPDCSTDSLLSTSPPTTFSIEPMSRPRLPSVSEQPSVAPIPENMPLPDSPRRPPLLCSMSLDSSGVSNTSGVGAGSGLNKGAGQDGSKGRDGTKAKDDVNGTDDSLTPVSRPRSGTWSLANSRRAKKERAEREEDVQARQRRRSGDDSLMNTQGGTHLTPQGAGAPPHTGSRDRKKEQQSPGLFESIRPRSKSDAARLAHKKPNFMTTMKQAVQHSLVSPSGGRSAGGRRSGESTPPHDAMLAGRHGPPASGTSEEYQHYSTWHAGGPERTKTSSLFKVLDLFDKKRRPSTGKNERGRRNSGDVADRARNSSSGSQSSVYIRGSMAPDYVAGVFREARALPAADPKLLVLLNEEEESQILVKFFKLHHSYDLIPTSAKLVIFDTSLQVKKAFYALVHNGVRAAPLWDHKKQKFVGMLTITDFIRILQSFYHNHDTQMEQLEDHRLHMWRTILKDEDRPLISTTPEESLFDAIHSLIRHKIHRLPVIDEKTGNVLYIITHKRILKFLYLYIRELPKPHVLNKTIGELDLGTYTNIETATPDTLLIEALNKFVERRISALPIVDQDGKLIDIYAKFDVINLAAEGTYNKLDVTLRQANESRNEWFEGVLSCTKNETLKTVMDRIVNAEVHRLVVVDDEKRVIGIVSLSDILNELVLKPAEAKEASLKDVLQNTNVCDINKSDDGSGSNNDDGTTKQEQEEEVVTNASPTADLANQVISAAEQHQDPPSTTSPKKDTSPGDSEDEGRYSMDKSEEVDRSEDGGSEALLQS